MEETERLNFIQTGAPGAWRGVLSRLALGLLFSWGLFRCTETAYPVYLYLFPTLGYFLIYTRLRELRRQSAAFYGAWVCSLVQLVLWGLALFCAAGTDSVRVKDVADGALLLSRVVLLAFLDHAFKSVIAQARLRRRSPFGQLLFLTVVALVVRVLGATEVLLPVLPVYTVWLLVLLVLTLRLGMALDAAGHPCPRTQARIPTAAGLPLYLVFCAAFICAGCLAGGHLRLSAEPLPPSRQAGERERLAELGFPAHILADVPDADLGLLEQIRAVTTQTITLPESGVELTVVWGDCGEGCMLVLVGFRRGAESCVLEPPRTPAG